MCPLYPLHLVLTYGALVMLVWAAGLGGVVGAASTLSASLSQNQSKVEVVQVMEGEVTQLTFFLDDLPPQVVADVLVQDEKTDGLDHIGIQPDKVEVQADQDGQASGSFNVTGKLLGFTKVKLVLDDGADHQHLQASEPIQVKVERGHRVLDKVFVHVVVLLVVVVYINMGCAIDLGVIRDTLRRPIAPTIGLLSQYLFMPLVSYLIGMGLFHNTPEMWLGVFLTGCSPGGGGSNMWTLLLGGSLDLSVTMTFLSTVAAFLALPLWVYGLARTIFQGGQFSRLPYRNIGMLVLGLVVPLSLGLLLQWKTPRLASVLRRSLRPLSLIFIIFIMTFGVYANFYIFAFFDWKVAVAGLLLPWLGFAFGALAALLCRRSWPEVIAISIETGVQNTGISIGILKVALGDYAPLGDVAMVVPVAVATMTPVPLTLAYLARRIHQHRQKATHKQEFEGGELEEGEAGDISKTNSTTPLHQNNNSNKVLSA